MNSINFNSHRFSAFKKEKKKKKKPKPTRTKQTDQAREKNLIAATASKNSLAVNFYW